MLENTNPNQNQQIILKAQTAQNPEDTRAFAELFFNWVPESDLLCYDDLTKEKMATLAHDALLSYKSPEPLIEVNETLEQKDGRKLTIFTIVNDNKPFLVDTIIGQINQLKLSLQLIAHPVFSITKLEDNALAIQKDKNTATDHKRLSVVQIHLSKLDEETKEKFLEVLKTSLTQVSLAVKDWKNMVSEIQEIISNYKQPIPKQSAETQNQVVDLLSWLVNDNFVILGMREYCYNEKADNGIYLYPQGTQLGILSDESILILKNSLTEETPSEILSFMQSDSLFVVTKANARSLVHRQAWLDYIGVKLFDKDGNLYGEMRIIGLFRANAYTNSIFSIPPVKTKAEAVIDNLGFATSDYSGKAIINILETYPRELLFRISTKDLTAHVKYILELKERPKTRVLLSDDSFGRFVSILIYIPRDLVNFGVQQKITNLLIDRFESTSYDFSPLFLENSLTYLNYTIYSSPQKALPALDRQKLEQDIKEIATPWSEAIEAASLQNPNIGANAVLLAKSFSQAYKDSFEAPEAIIDAEQMLTLNQEKPLAVRFSKSIEDDNQVITLKLYHKGQALALSERVPLLERMGFKVIAEQTFALKNANNVKTYIHDMQLASLNNQDIDLEKLSALLEESFFVVWTKKADNDYYNSLILSAHLNWRQIVVLRAYGRYLQQAGVSYSQELIAKTLNNNPNLSKALYELFDIRFNPKTTENREQAQQELLTAIAKMIQEVQSLDEDTIFRRYLCLITSTLRTNVYQNSPSEELPEVVAFKLDPSKIDFLPQPVPYREIFVYSTAVEGLHLRFGPIARGGIRWSDRAQDYRTEILGLAKAQQVKNTVIVPLGSKGGFYPKALPLTAERAVINEAGRAAYIMYISALLSVTDNIVNHKVVTPPNLVKYDNEDPYFVVAADKGTATFSDTANKISEEKNFWLDDAFASGGSAGYDHKKMGITAKGAWEAVKRHFREMDYDIQTQPFTAVGVGDMSGDVFGNGMLLSRQTKLIAAFDHRDIFIDPNPNLEESFKERERLFALERSSWQNYDPAKISKGGGVFSRSSKTITLSPEAAQAIGFDKQEGTPFEIMSAILKAPVDLLWFGGIGTYIKGENESNSHVGDHANDSIRVAAKEVRAKVIGEGANLGVTALGRIEFSLNGGRCNSDAIDNSAGVNCSDVEVNIKIAFAHAMADNKLSREERNFLLEDMTPAVSDLVLHNNYEQTLTLSLEENKGLTETSFQDRFMTYLESRNLLDRAVETLPSSQEIEERIQKKRPLTRPELAIVMAYAKNTLTQDLTEGTLISDPYFKETLTSYFPKQMQEKFAEEIENHRLRQNIISMRLANDIINRCGATSVYRLQDALGTSVDNILRAYVIARDGFDFPALYKEIDDLDNKISGKIQNKFYALLSQSLIKTTGWLLRHFNNSLSLQDNVEAIQEVNNILQQKFKTVLPQVILDEISAKESEYQKAGVHEALSLKLAYLEVIPFVPDIMLVAQKTGVDVATAAKNYFLLSNILGKSNLEATSLNINVTDYYDSIALDRANDIISGAFRNILISVLSNFEKSNDEPVNLWEQKDNEKIAAMRKKVKDLLLGPLTISRFTVAACLISDFAAGLNLDSK